MACYGLLRSTCVNKDIEKHIGGTKRHELPEHLYISYRKSVRLEWLTIIYLASVIVLLYLTMGSSAAMKTVWSTLWSAPHLL